MAATLGQIEFFDRAHVLSWTEMAREIDAFLARVGLDFYSFLPVRKGEFPKGDVLRGLKTNYEDDWVQRYCERSYNQVDPVCEMAGSARSPYHWGTESFLGNFEKRQRRVFYEAREYGIRYGFSLPIISADGGVALVSFSSDNRSTLREVIKTQGAMLHMASHQICDNLVRPREPRESEANPLSSREREALAWVARGMTSEELADRMFLSVSAVNYHLGNASRKLSARNRHHAALLALAGGYI